MVPLTLSLCDVKGPGKGGLGGAGVGRVAWLETFCGSKIAASKCKGSWRQASPRENPWREAGEPGEGARVGVGIGVEDLLTGCQHSNKITMSKVSGEERLNIWSLVNAH